MFKLLLSLWWIQWRRDFHWGRLFMVAYFGGLMLLMVIAMLFALSQALAEQLAMYPIEQLALPLVVSFALPDVMLKLMWGGDAVVMDDFLRTKPVPGSAWNRLMGVTMLIDPWNWLFPALTALVCFWLMPAGVAVLATMVSIVQTQAAAWAVAAIHKAPGNQYTLPVWAGLIIYYIGMLTLSTILGVLAMLPDSTLVLPGSPWTQLVLLMAVDAGLLWLLYRYFGRLHAYDEHEQHADKVRSMGDITLFSTEYLSVWRSKRFRLPMVLIIALFLLQAYQQQGVTLQEDFGGLNIGLFFCIGWPSLFLGQWVFGIEGNYFHGLWTKPYSIEQMLENKYRFFVMLSACVSVLLVPAVFFMGLRVTTLIALFLFLGCGQSLMMMPTCLFSTRVDLFSSAFFNYQGANKGVNIYSFMLFIPMAIYVVCVFLLPPYWGDALMAAIGVAAWAVHRPCVKMLARRWKANRYANMERYLK